MSSCAARAPDSAQSSRTEYHTRISLSGRTYRDGGIDFFDDRFSPRTVAGCPLPAFMKTQAAIGKNLRTRPAKAATKFTRVSQMLIAELKRSVRMHPADDLAGADSTFGINSSEDISLLRVVELRFAVHLSVRTVDDWTKDSTVVADRRHGRLYPGPLVIK